MNHISYYYQQLSDRDKYMYRTFVKYYKYGSRKNQVLYMIGAITQAQNEKYTYREVLKLISI